MRGLVGQPEAVKLLESASPVRARLLLLGPDGCGRTTAARLFARATGVPLQEFHAATTPAAAWTDAVQSAGPGDLVLLRGVERMEGGAEVALRAAEGSAAGVLATGGLGIAHRARDFLVVPFWRMEGESARRLLEQHGVTDNVNARVLFGGTAAGILGDGWRGRMESARRLHSFLPVIGEAGPADMMRAAELMGSDPATYAEMAAESDGRPIVTAAAVDLADMVRAGVPGEVAALRFLWRVRCAARGATVP